MIILNEEGLWIKIRNKQLLGVKFHRQQILFNAYITDFHILFIQLIIELNGFQHELVENKAKDAMRDNKSNSAKQWEISPALKRDSGVAAGCSEQQYYAEPKAARHSKLNNAWQLTILTIYLQPVNSKSNLILL